MRNRQILISVGICVLALFFDNAHAATLTVLNLNDAGAGSLRDQILTATPGDTVVFDAGITGTIPLASTLTVAQDLTIQGPGAGNLTISGQGAVGVFAVTGGALTVSGVTVANGFSADKGGGFNVTTTLTLRGSVLSGNSATSGGGAIHVAAAGTLTVTDSTFANNGIAGAGFGGALLIFGNATLTGNTLVGNTGFQGAAINGQPGSSLTIINNTFRANIANSAGGAIVNFNTTTAINNTFSGNQATDGAGVISTNTNAKLHNNVFADNVTSGATAALSPVGSFAASSNNVFYNNRAAGVADDQTGYGTSNFVLTGTQPLGALANNGGLTQTMLPVQGGAATCAGAVALLPGGITTDQRGNPRTSGACLDAGSVQRGAIAAAATQAAPIPTLSTWALMLLGGLMAMFGIRRSNTAKQ